MTIVLDANAAIETVLQRPRSGPIQDLLLSSSKVITTALYKAEVTNVMSKYVKGGYITKDTAITLLECTVDLIDEYADLSDYCIESLHESLRLNHPAYDMFYLVLARRTGSLLVTLDRKLLDLAVQEGLEIYSF